MRILCFSKNRIRILLVGENIYIKRLFENTYNNKHLEIDIRFFIDREKDMRYHINNLKPNNDILFNNK